MAQIGGKRPGAGRPPGKVGAAKRNLADLAKGHAEAAMKTLVDIAKDRQAPPAARVSAATAILDRGFGKPAQAMTVGNPDGTPMGPSIIQIVAGCVDGSD